eukprot:TRINITY_DN30246_c0_g1_i1.p2 TRINITY_DN30246_c0_g1~~TRINITY_DN30246_c0_g1_i1.p2  ORF type:complete len:122 (-),score=12.12 TRINITY_DN30246_c0_g1_i1:625-990(-)
MVVAFLTARAGKTLRSTSREMHHYALEEHGCLLVRNALPSPVCDALARYVDAAVDAAERAVVETGDTGDAVDVLHFASIRCRQHRCDFLLEMAPEVREALSALLHSVHPLLEQRVTSEARL